MLSNLRIVLMFGFFSASIQAQQLTNGGPRPLATMVERYFEGSYHVTLACPAAPSDCNRELVHSLDRITMVDSLGAAGLSVTFDRRFISKF